MSTAGVTPAEAAWETAAKGFFDAVHHLAANYPGVPTEDVVAKAQEFQAQAEALKQVYQAVLPVPVVLPIATSTQPVPTTEPTEVPAEPTETNTEPSAQ